MILVPLVTVNSEQIATAALIHDRHMPGWARTDRALTLLAESVPGLGLDAVTLKAAAVDRLYNTCHYGLDDASNRHLQGVCSCERCSEKRLE